MDGQEHDELLYRVDERLERIESEHIRRLQLVEERANENRANIEQLDSRVQKNETLLHVMTAGLGSVITAAAAKIGGLFAVLRGII